MSVDFSRLPPSSSALALIENDPWYRRSEFWTMVGAVLQSPFLRLIPGAGPVLTIASAILAAAAPLLYMNGRSQFKKAVVTPAPRAPARTTDFPRTLPLKPLLPRKPAGP